MALLDNSQINNSSSIYYTDLLYVEELYYKEKARVKWLKERDKNSKKLFKEK